MITFLYTVRGGFADGRDLPAESTTSEFGRAFRFGRSLAMHTVSRKAAA